MKTDGAPEHLKIRGPHCMRCGKPVRREETEYCRDCTKTDFSYDRGRSLFLHQEPVSSAIYQFKFHNKRIYGSYFAKELAEEYREQIRRWNIREIIPVPLHPKKRRKRGYNQAEILAKELGKLLEIQVNTDCVYRIINTRPQKELNDKERRRNLRKAFAIDSDWKPRGNVLVIDDIYTTGSTIDAVSRLLKKRGTEHVYFLTVSVGQGD
ncbi:MAG: ComF family protein [Hespellia sp.]|nr:ComF family protein [Hespellia sp.]